MRHARAHARTHAQALTLIGRSARDGISVCMHAIENKREVSFYMHDIDNEIYQFSILAGHVRYSSFLLSDHKYHITLYFFSYLNQSVPYNLLRGSPAPNNNAPPVTIFSYWIRAQILRGKNASRKDLVYCALKSPKRGKSTFLTFPNCFFQSAS